MNKEFIKSNQAKMSNWLKIQPVTFINLIDITLTEPIHIHAKPIYLDKAVQRIERKGVQCLNNPIIVRLLNDNRYTLVQGYKSYMLAKVLMHGKIPVVVVDMNRRAFVKYLGIGNSLDPINTQTILPIGSITIPEEFLRTQPKPEKVEAAKAFYTKYGYLDKPIALNKDHLLTDKYARYVAAKELGLNFLPVKIYEGTA